MFNRLRKLCGRYMRALLPRKLYKLIANGAIIVPAYYKDIIADAETNFDLSLEDTDDKAILLMRKYAHIIDKGLHRLMPRLVTVKNIILYLKVLLKDWKRQSMQPILLSHGLEAKL